MSNHKDFDLGAVEASASGMDAFFEEAPEIVTPLGTTKEATKKAVAKERRKITSLDQLDGFVRTASDTLVHKSDQELWSLQKDANGEFFIERQFDATDGPIKG